MFRDTLSHGIIIAAQSEADAERFRSLGASPERTWVTGNIKFDIELPDGLAEQGRLLRAQTFGDRPVWVAASTHDQEEQQVLDAHRQLQERHPDILLVLVPRHPSDSLRCGLDRQGRVSRRWREPRSERCAASTGVFLGDTMGEVPLFYAAATLLLSAAAWCRSAATICLNRQRWALPVISGPHVYNAQDISDMFIDSVPAAS